MVSSHSHLLDHGDVDILIDLSLREDGVDNDLTTKACFHVPGRGKEKIQAALVAKKTCVAAGAPLVAKILQRAKADGRLKASILFPDGSKLQEQATWMIFEGSTADLLTLERTLLNFLMRSCGIATHTQKIVAAVSDLETKILHTRKTAPGNRRTDVYASLVGGAHAHRRSLDDAILVKENHLRAAPSFQELWDGVNALRSQAKFVEVEVSNITELKYSLLCKPDRIMLDNFSPKDVAKAVNVYGGGEIKFEASGNINLDNVREYAETGVDYISLGAITHSAPSADLSLLFRDLQ